MQRLRICFVVTEVLGLERNGGIGTAITHMSLLFGQLGHDVEVLHCGHRTDVAEDWASRYSQAGVRISMLDRRTVVEPRCMEASWAVYHQLKERDLDAVVFQDWQGLGAMSALAKRAGAAFSSTSLIHHVHGPTDWLQEANRTLTTDVNQIIVAAMERTSAELCDHVVGPSTYLLDWMSDRGWRLPESRHTIPYFTAGHVEDLHAPLPADRPGGAFQELVFFGRLEERKGVRVLVEALNRLQTEHLAGRTVTFLGRSTPGFEPAHVRAMFDARVLDALGAVRFIDDLDQPHAREYLREPGRLAVIPSLIDNSPNVVYECIEDRVPFVASTGGGTGELVHPDDRATTLFQPTATSLAERLAAVAESGMVPPPARPAFDGPSTLAAWTELLAAPPRRIEVRETPLVTAVVPTHDRPDLLREAVRSLGQQDYANMEIVVVDDGSVEPRSIAVLETLAEDAPRRSVRVVRQDNRYLGAARNAGARSANGELLVFLDDDDLVAPTYVSRLVTAALSSDADAVTCAFEMLDASAGTDVASLRSTGVWAYLGGPLRIGPIMNVIGGAGMLVRRSTLEKVGGFHEQRGVGHEDWQLLVRILLEGGRVLALPEALYRYRYRPGTMIRTTNAYANARIVNDTYADHLPTELAQWPEMLRGLQERVHRADEAVAVLAAQLGEAREELDRRQRYIRLLEHARRRP